MKLEVGMYVRTDDGYIAKYDKSKHNCSGKYYGFASTIRDLRWEEYDDDCFLWESELKNIVKASYNITDLISRFDLVNGHLVICKMYEDEKDIPTIIKCVGDYYFKEEDIKSIITHEQIEQMEYKVGD